MRVFHQFSADLRCRVCAVLLARADVAKPSGVGPMSLEPLLRYGPRREICWLLSSLDMSVGVAWRAYLPGAACVREATLAE